MTTELLNIGTWVRSVFQKPWELRNLKFRERRILGTHWRVSQEKVNNKIMKEIKNKREMNLKLKDGNVFQHKTF